MKKTNKIISMLMVMLFLVTYVAPIGSILVYAEEKYTVDVQYKPEHELKKGDRFSINLTIGPGEGIKEFDPTQASVYVNDVAYETETAVITATSVYIPGLEYTGKGDQLAIEVYHKGALVGNVFIPLKVETTVGADALVISPNNTINVAAGQTQQISFTLKNNSGSPSQAGEMKLEVESKNTTSKGIKLKKTSFNIAAMAANESKDYQVTLEVAENVTRGIHKLLVTVGGKTQTIQLKVDSDFMPAAIEIGATNTDGFKAGVSKDITLQLKNVGQIAAKNVKIEVVQNDKVFILGGSNVKHLESIASNATQTVQMKLQVTDSSATTIPLQVKLTYIDDLGEEKVDSQYIYLSTQNAPLSSEVTVSNIKEPTGTYKVGETFNVGFTIYAKDGAKNLRVSVNGIDGIVPKSKNLFIIQDLPAGSSQQYSVSLTATDKIASSTHPIEIKVEYPLNGENVTFSQYATVTIDNPEKEDEDTKKGTPKVIIGEYTVNPVVVKAGEEFDLEIGFLNTSKDKTVSNLKANLTVKEQGENGTGTVFTPVGASNTFYIADLTPGQMTMKNIKLYTIPRALPKTYEITIEMNYEDAEGNEVTATENIGIPVEQVTALEIAEVQTEVVQVGMSMDLTATIYNTGKTDISNVMIRIEGEGFDVQDNKMFIGKFAQGSMETYMPTIIPYQPGNLKGTIIAEYEDSTGQANVITQDFEMEVMDMVVMPEGDWEETFPVEEEKPSKLPTFIGLFLGVGIAALVTMIVLKKRKAKQDEIGFDED